MFLNTGYVSVRLETSLRPGQFGAIENAVACELPGGWCVTEKPTETLLGITLNLKLDSSVGNVPPTLHPTSQQVELTLNAVSSHERIGYVTYSALEAARHEIGLFTVHGSAAFLPDHEAGVLLLGDKGAGKTSTLLGLVTTYRAFPVGDDILVLRSTSSKIELLGGKKIATVRASTHPHQFFFDTKTLLNLVPYKISKGPVPVSVVVRINVHSGNTSAVAKTVENGLRERLRLHENTLRFVSGLATPTCLDEMTVTGPVYRIDTTSAVASRQHVIDKLLTSPYLKIQARSASEAGALIMMALEKQRQA